MPKMLKHRTLQRISAFILVFVILFSPLIPVAAAKTPVPGVGDLLKESIIDAGDNYTYHENILQHNTAGRNEERIFELSPGGSVVPIVAYGSKLYGKSSIRETASYVEGFGHKVVGGVNGDFFMTDTGIPIGMVVTGGVLRSSDAGAGAVGFSPDGSTIIGRPKLNIAAVFTCEDGSAKNLVIDYVNKSRRYYGVYLFTPDFSANTRTTTEGINIVLTNIVGDLKIGGTVTATVESCITESSSLPLADGKMIISAETAQSSRLEGIVPGMTVSISVSASDERWNNVSYAVGGGDILIADGTVQSGFAAGAAPRTAVGVREDGSCVFYTVDGRQSGYSAGLSLAALAQRMAALGCVDAINLDGGGSTSAYFNYPGKTSPEVVNRPSEGSLRKTANHILFINNAPKTGYATNLHIYPYNLIMLSGAKKDLTALATDSGYYPVSVPSGLTFRVDRGLGSISGNVFTAGSAGSGYIYAEAGDARGSTPVTVVDTPTAIGLFNEKTGSAVSSIDASTGEVIGLRVETYYNGLVIDSSDDCYTWEVLGGVGTIDRNGTFTASTTPGLSGSIRISCGSFRQTIPVTTKDKPVTVLDFETPYNASSGSISLVSQNDMAYVHNGYGSGRLTYSFTDGKSWLRLPMNLNFTGRPGNLYFWVYGDNSGNALYFETYGDYGYGLSGMASVNFTGWRQIRLTLPESTSSLLALVLETPSGSGADGVLYLDQFTETRQAVEDLTPPAISFSQQTKADGTSLKLYATVKDSGPALLSEANITVTVDKISVPFTYNSATGALSADIALPDRETLHHVTITASDYFGNLSRSSYEVEALSPKPSQFEDSKGHWAENYINYVYEKGIVSGETIDGKPCYRPNELVTRLDFSVMMTKFLGIDETKYADVALPFTDTDKIPSSALNYVKAMYALGIIKGRGTVSLHFDPLDPIYRAEYMTIIGRTMPKGYAQKPLAYVDSQLVPDYAYEYVSVLTGLGVLSGNLKNEINTAGFLYRGEAAKIMCLLY